MLVFVFVFAGKIADKRRRTVCGKREAECATQPREHLLWERRIETHGPTHSTTEAATKQRFTLRFQTSDIFQTPHRRWTQILEIGHNTKNDTEYKNNTLDTE